MSKFLSKNSPNPGPNPTLEIFEILVLQFEAQNYFVGGMQDQDHSFLILTHAGKIVYSSNALYMQDSSLTGVIQAVIAISANQHPLQQPQLRRISASNHLLLFYLAPPIYLLAIVHTRKANNPLAVTSSTFIERQLHFLWRNIIFVLTEKGLDILTQNPSYDLRELLGGTDTCMSKLVATASTSLSILFQAFSSIPLPESLRSSLSSILSSAYTPHLFYSILFFRTKVLMAVQPKTSDYALRPGDLILLGNFVTNSASLRELESWIPICLPHFQPNGFFYAHVSMVSPEVYLVLLSTETHADQFHQLQHVKIRIHRALCHEEEHKNENRRTTNSLPTVQTLLNEHLEKSQSTSVTAFCSDPDLQHFLYYRPSLQQMFCPPSRDGYQEYYVRLHAQVTSVTKVPKETAAPRWIYERNSSHLCVGMFVSNAVATAEDYHVYAIFHPFADLATAALSCQELVRNLKTNDSTLFVYSPSWSSSPP